MSDRVSGAPTLEARMDDLRAVMDAAGSRRAAIFGVVEGAPMSLLFAATYPERVAALVLRSAFPRTMWAPDYPWGRSEDQCRRERRGGAPPRTARVRRRRRAPARWPSGTTTDIPAIVDYLRWCVESGRGRGRLQRMNREIDVRHVLPAIRVPTLIIHGSEDMVVPRKRPAGWPIASRARAASRSRAPPISTSAAARTRQRGGRVFLDAGLGHGAGSRPSRIACSRRCCSRTSSIRARGWQSSATAAWRELLERHHETVRRQLVRFRGRGGRYGG